MDIQKVRVIFRDTSLGLQRLQYAASLSASLGTSLYVALSHWHVPKGFLRENQEILLHSEELRRVRSIVSRIATDARCAFTVEAEFSKLYYSPGNCLVVDDESVRIPHLRCGAVASLCESSPFCRGVRKILVPLGNKNSGIRAMRYTLPLARRTNASILLYHATWRRAACPAEDPMDHVCDDAAKILVQAGDLAASAGVSYAQIVETPQNVAESICKVALREDCCLITLARGQNTLRGSYVDQVLGRSAVPILVVPEGGGY